MIFKSFFKKYNTGVTIFLLLILSSCNITHNISTPSLDLPSQYKGAVESDTVAVSIAPWREMYKEVHLRNLIEKSLLLNNDLNIALKNIEAAELLRKQSKLGYLPSAGLSVQANTSRPSDNSLNGLTLNQFLGSKHLEDYTASVELSWEADIWGKVKNQKADALAGFLQTTDVKKAIQTRLIAEISTAYYNLLMLDEQLRTSKENEKLMNNTIRIIKLQYQSGQVTSLAVEQAEVQQLAAIQLIPYFEQEIMIQENAISLLLGIAPSPVIRAASLDEFFPLPYISSGIPSALLNTRPDVKNAEREIDRANARVGISKSNMYPALTITAQAGVNSFQISNWMNIPASLFGNVIGGIAQPIFQQRKLKTEYEIAKIEREKAVFRFRQQVVFAIGEVSDALVRIDKLNQQRIINDSRTEKLRKTIVNADMLFKNGMANYLEVILAQSNVLQSELESSELKKSQLVSSVQLYRSIGGGWE